MKRTSIQTILAVNPFNCMRDFRLEIPANNRMSVGTYADSFYTGGHIPDAQSKGELREFAAFFVRVLRSYLLS